MIIDKLILVVKKDIQETTEYNEFLKLQMESNLTKIGINHLENMYFFNLGYQFAMEKLERLLEATNVD